MTKTEALRIAIDYLNHARKMTKEFGILGNIDTQPEIDKLDETKRILNDMLIELSPLA